MKVFKSSLFYRNTDLYREISDISIMFNSIYNRENIIQDDIFYIAKNYARKKEVELELLRIPIDDNELWAFTFVKNNIIFVCINANLPLNKEIFAMAHELYHIYCYMEKDSSLVLNGSTVLQSEVFNNNEKCIEDLEANAFAGLLLMPKEAIITQMDIYGINSSNIKIDDVIKLMDIFAVPYRAAVLRLIESEIIYVKQGEELLKYSSEEVESRIDLTGVAKRWQLDSRNMISFGTLRENMEFNKENDVVLESRYENDEKYISEIMVSLIGVK